MPTTGDLVRLQNKYKNEKVKIVSVYSARSPEDSFKKHTREKKINYAAIYDREDRIGRAFGVTDDGRKYAVTPTFLVGRNGKVIWEKAAFRHWPKSVATLETLIDAFLRDSR